jgi:hypothetical protein
MPGHVANLAAGRHHFIRDCMDSGRICVDYASTQEQLADILTKLLGRARFCEFRDMIGIVNRKN